MKQVLHYFIFVSALFWSADLSAQRNRLDFNEGWKFYKGDDSTARQTSYNDKSWRALHLPHDWSIEGDFSAAHPATFHQGALPTGIGWYRKTFSLPAGFSGKDVLIQFDGVYRNSEVWINGHYLGKRPNGYVSFRYDITPFVQKNKKNTIAVRVDNSLQPSSRWYTGSGIYRNVWLMAVPKISIDDRSVSITSEDVSEKEATVHMRYTVRNRTGNRQQLRLVHQVVDAAGNKVAGFAHASTQMLVDTAGDEIYSIRILKPRLWSVDQPALYRIISSMYAGGQLIDRYTSIFGIRSFDFDPLQGFFLNGKRMKILGVCNHHDLGALGAAVNVRALERQLQLLKAMGCNAIRTAHNPPAPELLDLCDRMGFLVMNEAFDMWKKKKNKYDYHMEFSEWHKKDLEDWVIRDRNHPSVFMWSIGNEIREQFDSSGLTITRQLADIIKKLDPSRPVTCALTENLPEKNFIYQSGALDVLGFNYKHQDYADLPRRFPGQKFMATETASALATRGHYDLPSDSNRIWPPDSKSQNHGNPDHTVSAYDHVYAYWGASHEVSWNAVKKLDHMAGIFVWSGFDFLGEPVPYQWPARSSYYGIIDLAGFPKDVYYMYQSEWSRKPVLHLFPHWNWEKGKLVDVWAYYNQADEAELYLNGRSLGKRKKSADTLHVMWRVPFTPGKLKLVSRKGGKTVLTKEIKTAGSPATIQLIADRSRLNTTGRDLAFVTVNVLDKDGNLVPYASEQVQFQLAGKASIAAVDNGNPVSHEPFKSSTIKAFHGKCLVVVQAGKEKGAVLLKASAPGLKSAAIILKLQ